MAQATISGTDHVDAALLTKTNANFTELYSNQTTLLGTSRVLVSTNDTTVGTLEEKIGEGNGITFITLNDGGDETFQIDSIAEEASYFSALMFC